MSASIFERSSRNAADAEELLDLVSDPLLAVTVDGTVVRANAAGRSLLGADMVGRNFSAALSGTPRQDLTEFLSRASGSTAPTLGALAVVDARGQRHRYQIKARRMARPSAGGRTLIGMRLKDARQGQFSALATTVRDLNDQMKLRFKAQADLETALDERELLLRELQHRVKNQLQILTSMCSGAARHAQGDELKTFLDVAQRRLIAMSVVHDAMNRASDLGRAAAGHLLREQAKAISAALCPAADVVLSVEDHEVAGDKALPIALIMSELLTNACKYGLQDGRGTIEIGFRRDDAVYELTIRDHGPGFGSAVRPTRRSGLGLVEGLAAQLNGTFAIESDCGARCVVRFEVRGAKARR